MSFWRRRGFGPTVVVPELAPRELKQFDRRRLDGSASPYLSVNLTRDGKRCNRFVQDLVCLAFYGPRPTPDHEARHLNGNAHDNRASNLAWGTREENTADRYAHQAWGRAWKKRREQLTEEPPSLDGETGHAFSGLIDP